MTATAVRPATEADGVIMHTDGYVDWRHDGGLHGHVLARRVIRRAL